MKFALAKQTLLDGLNKVAGVVSTRPSMPILSNVLLEAADGELKLTTTNMELTILAKVPCRVDTTPATLFRPSSSTCLANANFILVLLRFFCILQIFFHQRKHKCNHIPYLTHFFSQHRHILYIPVRKGAKSRLFMTGSFSR